MQLPAGRKVLPDHLLIWGLGHGVNGPVQAFQKKGAIYLGPRNGGTRRCTLKRYNVYKINQGQPERAESYFEVWLQVPLKAKLKGLRKD